MSQEMFQHITKRSQKPTASFPSTRNTLQESEIECVKLVVFFSPHCHQYNPFLQPSTNEKCIMCLNNNF